MNDETAAPARRDRMAIAAAQYIHQRAADTRRGKKDAQNAEAREAVGGGGEWGSDLQPDGYRRQ